MTTPDTQQDPAEPTEQEEALYSAVAVALEDITGYWRELDNAHMLQALRDPIAAIVRFEVAAHLTEQARSLRNLAAFYNKHAQTDRRDRILDAEIYATRASQALADADKLRRAAEDKIAEGYEHTCAASFAATWSDPGYGCETRVPDAGDYCSKHEPEDDEDRWAE